jgi:hypothetical protein
MASTLLDLVERLLRLVNGNRRDIGIGYNRDDATMIHGPVNRDGDLVIGYVNSVLHE